MSKLIAITQAYIPAYRVPLFDELAARAANDGNRLRVITTGSTAAQADRGDASSGAWHEMSPARQFTSFGRQVVLRSTTATRAADVVVTELDPGNLLAWKLAMTKRQRWIAWGHGKSYTTKPVWGSDRARITLASRANRVMTYSEQGRNFLLQAGGISPERIVAVGNSTDTKELIEARRPDLERPSRRAIFIGALDKSKRIDFILSAADEARRIDQSFTLIIVGRGPLSTMVEHFAESRPWVSWSKEARGPELVQRAQEASAVWMPGRVGLVAVDALALGLPVHTTSFRFHAPERDFLIDGRSAVVLPDEETSFARASLDAMERVPRFVAEKVPSVQAVAEKFYETVCATLREPASLHMTR